MTALEIPRFGELLSPFISKVPDGTRPLFLALLERGAANRYRVWAEQLPAHAAVLLECAESEDEIASRIEGAFALDESLRDELLAPLPQEHRPITTHSLHITFGTNCAFRQTPNVKVLMPGGQSQPIIPMHMLLRSCIHVRRLKS